MRGPLEAIKDGWLEGELSFSNSVKWVDDLRKTLSILQEQARKHEGRYKSIAKQYYDKRQRTDHSNRETWSCSMTLPQPVN